MTSWADIQRLASDLQRVQLSQSSKKLSEGNCIEVVAKLIERALINVVYTRDGHSYVTRKHLETEVKNECIAQGGRCPLTDIVTALNIDFEHIDRTAKQVVSDDSDFTLSNGELFSTEYVRHLESDLRSLLEENGYQTAANLCKHWDLSQDLLKSLLLSKLDWEGAFVMDGDTIYTRTYLNSRKLVLRAVLSAITKVTPINTIQQRSGLTTKLFWTAFDELANAGEVPGRIVGARTSPSCVYSPHTHERLVKLCVQHAIRQNEYLPVSTLKKLGVDGKQGVEALLDEKIKLISLQTIIITDSLLEQCTSLLQDELAKSPLVDVQTVLQPLNVPFEDSDSDEIAEQVASSSQDATFAQGYLFKSSLIKQAISSLSGKVEQRAQQEVERLEAEKKQGGKAQKKQTEEDEDWGDKKGKKKGKSAPAKSSKATAKNEKAGSNGPSVAVSEEEVQEWLKDSEVIPEEIVEIVAEQIGHEMTTVLRQKVAEIQASQILASTASQKKNLATMAEKILGLYDSFNTFEVASTSFPDPLGADLRQHLLKSLGAEISNTILAYVSGHDVEIFNKEKERDLAVEGLPKSLQAPLKDLFTSLKSENSDAFHDAIFTCSGNSVASLTLKKADKKKRTEVVSSLQEQLKSQLTESTDPAASLLLSVLYLSAKHGRPVSASGKFVASLVASLRDDEHEEVLDLLSKCQRGVVTTLKNKTDEVAKEMLDEDLKTLKSKILS